MAHITHTSSDGVSTHKSMGDITLLQQPVTVGPQNQLLWQSATVTQTATVWLSLQETAPHTDCRVGVLLAMCRQSITLALLFLFHNKIPFPTALRRPVTSLYWKSLGRKQYSFSPLYAPIKVTSTRRGPSSCMWITTMTPPISTNYSPRHVCSPAQRNYQASR